MSPVTFFLLWPAVMILSPPPPNIRKLVQRMDRTPHYLSNEEIYVMKLSHSIPKLFMKCCHEAEEERSGACNEAGWHVVGL